MRGPNISPNTLKQSLLNTVRENKSLNIIQSHPKWGSGGYKMRPEAILDIPESTERPSYIST